MTSSELLSRWIGSGTFAFQINLASGTLSGSMGLESLPSYQARGVVGRFQEEALAHNLRLFCGWADRPVAMAKVIQGGGAHIFALGTTNEADIADLCDVGVPMFENTPEKVQRTLEAVYGDGDWSSMAQWLADPPADKARADMRRFMDVLYSKKKFCIDYADRGGLEAHFIETVDESTAGWAEREAEMLNMVTLEGPQPFSLKRYILETQRLILSCI